MRAVTGGPRRSTTRSSTSSRPVCSAGLRAGLSQRRALRGTDGGTRTALATSGRITPWWQRLGFRVLGHHRTLLAGPPPSPAPTSTIGSAPPRGAALPLVGRRRASRGRRRHGRVAVHRLRHGRMAARDPPQLRRADHAHGSTFAVPVHRVPVAGRCTSMPDSTTTPLHSPTSDGVDARRGPDPRHSAGCGAAMKDYGELLGTDAANTSATGARHQRVARRAHDLLPASSGPGPSVIIQDPATSAMCSGPRNRSVCVRPRRRHRRARRRRSVLWCGRRLFGAAAGTGR